MQVVFVQIFFSPLASFPIYTVSFCPGLQYQISCSFKNDNTLSLISSDMGGLPQSVGVQVSLATLYTSDLLAGEKV